MIFTQTCPQITYEYTKIRNIFRRIAIIDEYKSEVSYYTTHSVKDGETPHSIAAKFYGTPDYYFVVLMMNDIIDPLYEWPVSYGDLERRVVKAATALVDTMDETYFQTLVNDYTDVTWNTLTAGQQNTVIEGLAEEMALALLKSINLEDNVKTMRDATRHFCDDFFDLVSPVDRDTIKSYLSTALVYTDLFAYYSEKNEKNRDIKILKPQYIKQLVYQIERGAY